MQITIKCRSRSSTQDLLNVCSTIFCRLADRLLQGRKAFPLDSLRHFPDCCGDEWSSAEILLESHIGTRCLASTLFCHSYSFLGSSIMMSSSFVPSSPTFKARRAICVENNYRRLQVMWHDLVWCDKTSVMPSARVILLLNATASCTSPWYCLLLKLLLLRNFWKTKAHTTSLTFSTWLKAALQLYSNCKKRVCERIFWIWHRLL